jgi:hypothetical protein
MTADRAPVAFRDADRFDVDRASNGVDSLPLVWDVG